MSAGAAPVAEATSWQDRLKDARQRMVFEPTPSGATPYVGTLERACDVLDAVEVAAAASGAGTAAAALAHAIAFLLREHINSRQREILLRSRLDIQPDRVDDLCRLVEQMLAQGPPRA